MSEYCAPDNVEQFLHFVPYNNDECSFQNDSDITEYPASSSTRESTCGDIESSDNECSFVSEQTCKESKPVEINTLRQRMFNTPRFETDEFCFAAQNEQVRPIIMNQSYDQASSRKMYCSREIYRTPHKRHSLPVSTNTRISSPGNSCQLTPIYKHHQLMGDSQFVRFASKLLNYQWSKRIGYCVSGQKTEDLLKMVKNKMYPMEKNIIMMIGTNDLLQNIKIEDIMKSYNELVCLLKNQTEKLVLITVPPVPRLEERQQYHETWAQFRNVVLRFADDTKVFVVDAAQIFATHKQKGCDKYYEEVMGASQKVDKIHLNKKGLLLLKNLIDIHYFK